LNVECSYSGKMLTGQGVTAVRTFNLQLSTLNVDKEQFIRASVIYILLKIFDRRWFLFSRLWL